MNYNLENVKNQVVQAEAFNEPTGRDPDRTSWRRLRLLIVATLILLTVQGWFGDTVNIFLIPTTLPAVDQSAGGGHTRRS